MSRDNESSAVKIRCSYCGRECQYSIIHSGDQLRPYCSFECAQMAYRAQHGKGGGVIAKLLAICVIIGGLAYLRRLYRAQHTTAGRRGREESKK